MIEQKALPCPFCASPAVMVRDDHIFAGQRYERYADQEFGFRVECTSRTCHAMSCWWHTEGEALTAWNRRAVSVEAVGKPIAHYVVTCTCDPEASGMSARCPMHGVRPETTVTFSSPADSPPRYGCATCGHFSDPECSVPGCGFRVPTPTPDGTDNA